MTRKVDLSKHVELIEKLVIDNIYLSPNELFEMFCGKYPEIPISQPSFYKYLSQVDTYRVLQQIHKCLDKNNNKFKSDSLLSFLTRRITEPVIKKKIMNMNEIAQTEMPINNERQMTLKTTDMSYLVMFLVGSGMSYKLISFLLGISKSYVKKLVYSIQDVDQLLLSSIDKWSGKICVDEKYVKLEGKTHYIFSAVDAVTGVPLLMREFADKTALSWEMFFTEFKLHYKIPKLIISDGCSALASGRKTVFQGVPYQYCKFHKMKNLIKRIYENEKDPKTILKLINKVKQVFSRKLVGNRRKALLELEKMVFGGVKSYLDARIMKQWKHLTKSLTSNAAERNNRKIKKIVSGKYGLKSPETIQQMMNCLWLKELIMNGKHHLASNSKITNLNISKICQEMISDKRLEHLFSIEKQKCVV